MNENSKIEMTDWETAYRELLAGFHSLEVKNYSLMQEREKLEAENAHLRAMVEWQPLRDSPGMITFWRNHEGKLSMPEYDVNKKTLTKIEEQIKINRWKAFWLLPVCLSILDDVANNKPFVFKCEEEETAQVGEKN